MKNILISIFFVLFSISFVGCQKTLVIQERKTVESPKKEEAFSKAEFVMIPVILFEETPQEKKTGASKIEAKKKEKKKKRRKQKEEKKKRSALATKKAGASIFVSMANKSDITFPSDNNSAVNYCHGCQKKDSEEHFSSIEEKLYCSSCFAEEISDIFPSEKESVSEISDTLIFLAENFPWMFVSIARFYLVYYLLFLLLGIVSYILVKKMLISFGNQFVLKEASQLETNKVDVSSRDID